MFQQFSNMFPMFPFVSKMFQTVSKRCSKWFQIQTCYNTNPNSFQCFFKHVQHNTLFSKTNPTTKHVVQQMSKRVQNKSDKFQSISKQDPKCFPMFSYVSLYVSSFSKKIRHVLTFSNIFQHFQKMFKNKLKRIQTI